MKVKNSLFNDITAQGVVDRIKSEIDSPYKNGYVSRLGGKDDSSLLITIGDETKEQWTNGIFENSPYRRFHIDNDGTVYNFVSSELSHIRKFTAKTVDDLIGRLNKNLNKE